MDRTFIRQIRAALPETMPFTYFPDRESPWLLSEHLSEPVRLADLRRSPLARLAERPALRPVLAACGDGMLRPEDLAVLAEPERAMRPGLPRSGAADAALEVLLAQPWQSWFVTLDVWGSTSRQDWAWHQTSRCERNLVVQLNFPVEHQVDFWRCLRHSGKTLRETVEVRCHPIRQDGQITMGWARLDAEPWGEDLLIEELQSDWFREVDHLAAFPDQLSIRDRAELDHYRRHVMPAYRSVWDRALLLAVLVFARRELGVGRVWLHQPDAGRKLKKINWGLAPPRSLYTALPKRFGFEPVREVPPFLERVRRKDIAALRKSEKPLFWRLELTG